MSQTNPPVQITFTALPVYGATVPVTGSGQMLMAGSTLAGVHVPIRVLDDGSVVVNYLPMSPPDGGVIAGNDASNSLGTVTGSAYVTLINEGPGTVRVRSVSNPPTSGSGFPIAPGSYSWQAAAVESVKVYVPSGSNLNWGVHQ